MTVFQNTGLDYDLLDNRSIYTLPGVASNIWYSSIKSLETSLAQFSFNDILNRASVFHFCDASENGCQLA